jgi:hypothetical protein
MRQPIGFDLIIVANSVDMGSNRLTIAPLEGTIGETARGRHGHDITVVVQSLGPLSFDLSGGDGGKGDTGPDGVNGDPLEARRTETGGSFGTQPPGGPGGLGGDGGDLVVYFVDGDESMVSLESEGGAGGEGGDGGLGGFSYVYSVTKVLANGKRIYGEPLQELPLDGVRRRGPVGETGRPGQPGSLEMTRITTAEFRELVFEYVVREPEELVGSHQIFFANVIEGDGKDQIILEEVPEYKDPGDGEVFTPLTEP